MEAARAERLGLGDGWWAYMIVYLTAVLVIGLNFSLWGLVGALRLGDEALRGMGRRRLPRLVWHQGRAEVEIVRPRMVKRSGLLTCDDVAILIAAHNEELVIGASLAALSRLIPLDNVYVMSDASSDRTVDICRDQGATVGETVTNIGKANALRYGIEHFGLLDAYQAVMILDADTQLDPCYFDVALPLLDDPRVAAVAGCAHTRWQRKTGFVGSVLVAHRQRVYVLTQLLLKYGQTWRGVSATHIVPGFASIYRTRVLRQIDINPEGLVIEDFNMTFELHAKKLGRIAFHPGARAYTQDPDQYLAYVRQTKRWALGLWQTVRRHRFRVSAFNATLVLLLLELIVSSVLYLLFVPVLLLLVVPDVVHPLSSVPLVGSLHSGLSAHISVTMLVVGVLLPDYALSCFTAVVERRPRYLFLGLFFVAMKLTDAAIALYSLPRAWTEQSTGRWVSPPRRTVRSSARTPEDAGVSPS
ncbi:glycosyltransferase family 2 protein [Allobranchiibius sp. CTAmp26]|uniref:glycosyltransferase family 2 protein n=1 Tax=Allobranchiibius sp. CTAmp26 TaxID=2815214 RepID=UPI001AA148CB|nr:glycosyltransferase family 2 protein [Allobranchiibius sp. CTAmp26]MBO1755866.1 glycosyltransferase family 2 protein [Allobranchiibius sp. CTAmp26]